MTLTGSLGRARRLSVRVALVLSLPPRRGPAKGDVRSAEASAILPETLPEKWGESCSHGSPLPKELPL